MKELKVEELQDINGGFAWVPVILICVAVAGAAKGCSDGKSGN